MNERQDGGPAFPRPGCPHPGEDGDFGDVGMTLRDWFAGQALSGYIASHANESALMAPAPNDAARKSYEYADAMLKAREG